MSENQNRQNVNSNNVGDDWMEALERDAIANEGAPVDELTPALTREDVQLQQACATLNALCGRLKDTPWKDVTRSDKVSLFNAFAAKRALTQGWVTPDPVTESSATSRDLDSARRWFAKETGQSDETARLVAIDGGKKAEGPPSNPLFADDEPDRTPEEARRRVRPDAHVGCLQHPELIQFADYQCRALGVPVIATALSAVAVISALSIGRVKLRTRTNTGDARYPVVVRTADPNVWLIGSAPPGFNKSTAMNPFVSALVSLRNAQKAAAARNAAQAKAKLKALSRIKDFDSEEEERRHADELARTARQAESFAEELFTGDANSGPLVRAAVRMGDSLQGIPRLSVISPEPEVLDNLCGEFSSVPTMNGFYDGSFSGLIRKAPASSEVDIVTGGRVLGSVAVFSQPKSLAKFSGKTGSGLLTRFLMFVLSDVFLGHGPAGPAEVSGQEGPSGHAGPLARTENLSQWDNRASGPVAPSVTEAIGAAFRLWGTHRQESNTMTYIEIPALDVLLSRLEETKRIAQAEQAARLSVSGHVSINDVPESITRWALNVGKLLCCFAQLSRLYTLSRPDGPAEFSAPVCPDSIRYIKRALSLSLSPPTTPRTRFPDNAQKNVLGHVAEIHQAPAIAIHLGERLRTGALTIDGFRKVLARAGVQRPWRQVLAELAALGLVAFTGNDSAETIQEGRRFFFDKAGAVRRKDELEAMCEVDLGTRMRNVIELWIAELPDEIPFTVVTETTGATEAVDDAAADCEDLFEDL